MTTLPIINMMVKNEIRYIKQSLKSVLPTIGAAIIVDTGSTDGTREYLRRLAENNKRVIYQEIDVERDSTNWDGQHLNQPLTDIRNMMLKKSNELGYNWIFQVDGDEVYTNSALQELLLQFSRLVELEKNVGIMVPIKWCISENEYIHPGPFDRTLRIMRSDGEWRGRFPDEFLYIDNIPVTIVDRRCLVSKLPFLHMSMCLHPERRPAIGVPTPLSEDETSKLIPPGGF
jgi:glycosyltransferase involved in cell wall biosynthesis